MTAPSSKQDPLKEIRRLLKKRTADAAMHLEALQKTFEEEPVHDFRVSIRRLNALLLLLEGLADKTAPGGKASRKLKKWRKRFKRKLGVFGPLRDLQIFKLDLSRALPQAAGLLPLYEHLVIREYLEMEKARSKSGKLDPKVFSEALDPIMKELSDVFRDGFNPRAMDTLLDESFAALQETARALDLKDVGSFHALRIKLKKFRYAMEIRSQATAKLPEDSFKTLKSLQDLLGRIQDISVMTRILDEYAKSRSVPFELNLYYNHLTDTQNRLMNEAAVRLPELSALWPPA